MTQKALIEIIKSFTKKEKMLIHMVATTHLLRPHLPGIFVSDWIRKNKDDFDDCETYRDKLQRFERLLDEGVLTLKKIENGDVFVMNHSENALKLVT